jgi:Flp pilus assembly protein TadG
MLKFLGRFLKAKDGLAAVEFGFIAPFLITMVFGTIEVSNALNCKANVTSLASTAADLVAQDNQVTDSDMANVFNALNALLYPYPSTNAKIIISSVIDNGSGGAKVAWSDAQNTTARSVGSAVTVPTGLITSGGSVVMVEVTYTYTSASTQIVKLPITMTNTFYTRPRRVAQISRTAT